MTFYSQGKTVTQSKTLWFNGIVALLAALNSMTETIDDPVWGARIAAAVAVINLILRFYTKDPIVPPGSQP